MTGEELRKALRLSPATLSKLFRGGRVSDAVFQRVVLELERRPVVPIALELTTGRNGPSAAPAGGGGP
jgi:hypothetical protein